MGGGSLARYVVNIFIAFVIASCHAGGGVVSSAPMADSCFGALCNARRRADPAFRDADDSDNEDIGEDVLECPVGWGGDAAGLNKGSCPFLLPDVCRTCAYVILAGLLLAFSCCWGCWPLPREGCCTVAGLPKESESLLSRRYATLSGKVDRSLLSSCAFLVLGLNS